MNTRAPVSRSRKTLFIVLMILGVLAFAEAAGAAFYFWFLPEQEREAIETLLGRGDGPWNNVLRYRPHPYLNFISNPDYVFPDGTRPHIEPGLRATDFALTDKAADTFRIVALGASTTYGFYAADGTKTWPNLIQLGLRDTLGEQIQVVNAGIPNYTTFEMIGFAATWLPELRPDLVLLNVGVNDAFAIGFPDEGGPDNSRFRFSWSYRPASETLLAPMRRSFLVRSIGGRLLMRNGYYVGDANGAMQHPLPPEPEVREHVASATGKYFRRNVETLVLLARRTGAKVVLVTEPLNPEFETGQGFYHDAVSKAIERNNRILREIGASEGLEVLDLHEGLRDPSLFVDAVHVNMTGMVRKAQTVYDAVLPMVSGHGGIARAATEKPG